MKKIFSLLFLVGMLASAQAQIKTPSASPFSKLEQTVGLTDVTIEYSRPGVKDRDIFGGLVPYGDVWRTGANSVTKITFNKDVQVEGKDLKAGSYAILTTPGKSSWDVNFYDYNGSRWSPYKEATPVATVSVSSAKTSQSVESFTISVDDLRDASATINMAWANTRVPLKLAVHTDKQAMASIDKLIAGPSKGEYYNIAS